MLKSISPIIIFCIVRRCQAAQEVGDIGHSSDSDVLPSEVNESEQGDNNDQQREYSTSDISSSEVVQSLDVAASDLECSSAVDDLGCTRNESLNGTDASRSFSVNETALERGSESPEVVHSQGLLDITSESLQHSFDRGIGKTTNTYYLLFIIEIWGLKIFCLHVNIGCSFTDEDPSDNLSNSDNNSEVSMVSHGSFVGNEPSPQQEQTGIFVSMCSVMNQNFWKVMITFPFHV